MKEKIYTKESQPKCGKWYLRCLLFILVLFYAMRLPIEVQAKETIKMEFFYENVCAPCDGTEDFYRIYNSCITPEQKEKYNIEVTSYNVFMDAHKDYYTKRAEQLGITAEVSLPILIVEEQWVSGYEQMETLLSKATPDLHLQKDNVQADGIKAKQDFDLEGLTEKIEKSGEKVLLFFTTDACKDCEQVKEWLEGQTDLSGVKVLEVNIIQDNGLGILKQMFREYGILEKEQKVPAFFYGDNAIIGADNITAMQSRMIEKGADNHKLVDKLRQAKENEKEEDIQTRINIPALAGAGLLAGLNPCSISMLLMLLSLLISEKASVLKHGACYLCGKYITYFAIGIIIYKTASQIDSGTLKEAGEVINGILVVLFGVAAVLYFVDAVRIYRKDYGGIRTQLPVGLRRWNHNLIRNAFRYSGFLKPLLIMGLGAAISMGEFFCTGQIYMATITYMLQEQMGGVWIPFVIYVTAMSLPAMIMIGVIQRTRNTEYISEFMLRHLGAIKIFNGVLFVGFMVYFLLR